MATDTTTSEGADLEVVAADLARDGVAVVTGVLDRDRAADALARLWAASRESERRGIPPHIVGLDPNAPTCGCSTSSTSTRCSAS